MLRVKTDHFLKGCRGSSVMPTWAQESFILEASGPASVLKQNESMLRVKTDHFFEGPPVAAGADSRQSTERLTRIAEADVLSCCRASSSGSCSSLKATKHLTKLASTSSTEIKPSWESTCNVANGATGQPLFIWQCDTFLFRASGATTASARLARRQGVRCRHSNSNVCW